MEGVIDCRNSTSSQRICWHWRPFSADVNLIVQLAMGGALVAGVILAKSRASSWQKRSVAELTAPAKRQFCCSTCGWSDSRCGPLFGFKSCRTSPKFSTPLTTQSRQSIFALGTAAEVLGIYIVLVAATKLVPHHCASPRGSDGCK